jgi:hypothetical protein
MVAGEEVLALAVAVTAAYVHSRYVRTVADVPRAAHSCAER